MKKQLSTILKNLKIPVEVTKIEIKREQKNIRDIYLDLDDCTNIKEAIDILKKERKELGRLCTIFFNLESRVKDTLLSKYKEHKPLGNYEEVKRWVQEPCDCNVNMFIRCSGHGGEYRKVTELVEFEPETNYDRHSEQFYKEFKEHNDSDFVSKATEYFIKLNEKIQEAKK